MPKIKKEQLTHSLGNGLGYAIAEVEYHVNAAGEFYCVIPENILEYFEKFKVYDGITCKDNRKGKLSLYSKTLDALESLLRTALVASYQPTITEELVIQYNLESQVSFATDPDGNVFPNARYPNAEWNNDKETRKMYGDLNATHRTKGGFSLCIGAKAMRKITRVIGTKESVEYKNYYGEDGSHLGCNTPAEMLNSWTGYDLPSRTKEIPYSDEAALFFHNLMLGMATISKQIQEATFHQEDLLNLIASGAGNFLAAPKAQESINDESGQ